MCNKLIIGLTKEELIELERLAIDLNTTVDRLIKVALNLGIEEIKHTGLL